MDIITVAFISFIFGAIINTVYGFLTKMLVTDDPLKFDSKFIITMVISIITTMMIAIGAFASFPIPIDVPLIYIVLAAVTSGYTLNNLVNRGVTTYTGSQTPAPVKTIPPPPTTITTPAPSEGTPTSNSTPIENTTPT